MKILNFVAVVAVILYTLCWFTHQPTSTLYWLGIFLPWLSLFLSIPISYVCKVKEGEYFKTWGWVYAISTLLYITVVSMMSGSVLHQLPHLGACVCFIAYFSLEHRAKNNFP